MKKLKKFLKKLFTKKNIIIFSIMLSIIIIGILLIIFIPKPTNDNNINEEQNVVEKIDQMENYDYYLDETATDYYKELYNELKTILNSEEVNDEEYAKIISKLFITDLFTLDNKITSSDIGGLQFVYPNFKEDFVNIAKNTLYSSVESNIYNDREQELPIVLGVEVSNIVESTFNYNEIEYNCYDVTVNITYEVDLGYPTSYDLTLIKNDKYYQVVAGE